MALLACLILVLEKKLDRLVLDFLLSPLRNVLNFKTLGFIGLNQYGKILCLHSHFPGG